MRYRIGDEVVLKVNLGSEEKPRWDRRKVQVIGLPDETGDGQYICYVPAWLNMPHTFKLNRRHQDWYDFHDKFLGDQGCFITDKTEIYAHHPTPDGENCDNCGTFVRWAEADEWGEFTCRRCRENPYR